MSPSIRHVELPTHRAELLEWGPADGPLALLLHGFPDSAWTWRHLGPVLAEHGYHAVAPFTRGYAPSGVPSDTTYTVGSLMADAVALHGELGGDAGAVLIGHDWGAITANALAAHPDSPFGRVVSLAVPPLSTMNPTRDTVVPWLGAVVRQPVKSWYIFLNQLPGISEQRLDRLVPYLWRTWSPGYDASEDVEHALAAAPDEAHARAIVSYYRAFLRPGPRAVAYKHWQRTMMDPPQVPLLYLHGAQDGCLEPRFFPLVTEHLPEGASATLVPGAGHFLHVEDPATVNGLVVDFLGHSSP
ncbi:alpha/beta fold hydrolase [Nocardioides sp. CN2-186]|uniref:alpha/beta fold hydrolase n=1 Tax=Nocardioides tweenelious TaxID=3156607 RepID=UPI0032B49670